MSELYEIYRCTAQAGAKAGADFILAETMMDLNELEAAVKAASETGLPVMATMSFNENGRTMYGASIKSMVELLEGLGVVALGLNCGFGPEAYRGLVADLLAATSLPVILQPNAGLPDVVNGVPVYNLLPDAFAGMMAVMAKMGCKLLGGCCGTGPEHISAMVKECLKAEKV
jgi:5-methyltetrahydrofolate--homocysteine methyltransferase